MAERQYTEEEQALEIQSLRRIISAYLNYPDAAEKDVQRYERSFKKLSPAHKILLSHLQLKYQRLRWCISMNTSFIMRMIQAFEAPFDMGEHSDANEQEYCDNCCGHNHSEAHSSVLNSNQLREPISLSSSELSLDENIDCQAGEHVPHEDSIGVDGAKVNCVDHGMDPLFPLNVPPVDVDKVRCIIRNIVRDWAQEGKKERDECYKPILDELNHLFPDRCMEKPPSCLVPGAGLGRLAMDISCLGFVSQGNEFSYYMMICSSFILNHATEAYQWTIYPWIHSNCNNAKDDDQLRPVSFPDILPSSAGITEGFSMCAGDFVEVYSEESHEASWDAVVTCFFLDTAHNIVEYIQIISRIIKDGGVWINLGPLLYHFADTYEPNEEMSIELSLEDVKKIALHYEFEMEAEKIVETTYTANARSMMQNRYWAAFWTMRRKPRTKG